MTRDSCVGDDDILVMETPHNCQTGWWWWKISDFYAWQMWRNLKFLHIWHVCDVENVSTCVQFMLFCYKIGFVAIYALLSRNLFCRDLRTFVWRKIEPKIASVDKKWQIWGMPYSIGLKIIIFNWFVTNGWTRGMCIVKPRTLKVREVVKKCPLLLELSATPHHSPVGLSITKPYFKKFIWRLLT